MPIYIVKQHPRYKVVTVVVDVLVERTKLTLRGLIDFAG